MVSIYFEDKVINFTDCAGENPDGELLSCADLSITKVLQKLENNNTLWVVSPDYSSFADTFRALFHQAEAAGGLVTDPAGRVLMIHRNGRWDLPKGHRESGESWKECALREVGEECGIDVRECGRELTVTFHTYLLEDRWTLKHTHWFAMDYNGSELPTPQTEEGIDQVKWFAPGEELQQALSESYITIRNVFKCI